MRGAPLPGPHRAAASGSPLLLRRGLTLQVLPPCKESYDNTLEVEDRGGDRLRFTLAGTDIYKANGGESMHECGGEGEVTLRGNVATARVTSDGGDAPCRVLIIFEGGEAGVRTGSSCGFNVDISGINRKAGAALTIAAVDNAGLRQVRYDWITVRGSVSGKVGHEYLLAACEGQRMAVHLSGQSGAVFDIKKPLISSPTEVQK